MNLKESFRYQNYFDSMAAEAHLSITKQDHCMTTKKTHLRSKANPEANDIEEVVEPDEYFKNDDVVAFYMFLIEQKQRLGCAISKAKAGLDIDIDAAVASNKYRRSLARAIQVSLSFKPKKKIEQGHDYKFNNEGNQAMYCYDIEVETSDNFDRHKARAIMRRMSNEADAVSEAVDLAMVNTEVAFTTPFDVNDSFEDSMKVFLELK